MNLQQEIIDELGSQMQSQIDFQILADMLVQACGWHKIELIRFDNNRQAVDIKLWLEENANGHWESRGSTFVFENSGDAINFTLRWK